MIIIITTISIFALSLLRPSWKLPAIIIIITTTIIIIIWFDYRLADTVQLLTSWMFTDAARWKPLPTSPTSPMSSMLSVSSSWLWSILTLLASWYCISGDQRRNHWTPSKMSQHQSSQSCRFTSMITTMITLIPEEEMPRCPFFEYHILVGIFSIFVAWWLWT